MTKNFYNELNAWKVLIKMRDKEGNSAEDKAFWDELITKREKSILKSKKLDFSLPEIEQEREENIKRNLLSFKNLLFRLKKCLL